MKKLALIISAIVVSGSAMANFTDNRSEVRIFQNSDANKVDVRQISDGSSNGHKSDVKIDNKSSDNRVFITQRKQKNNSDVDIKDGSDNNRVWVTQKNGKENKSDVLIKGNANNNKVSLVQNGSDNRSDILINEGDHNRVWAKSVGDDNRIDVDILGNNADNNLVDIVQRNDGSKAEVLINDHGSKTDFNRIFITQHKEDYSFVKVTNGSDGNLVTTYQH